MSREWLQNRLGYDNSSIWIQSSPYAPIFNVIPTFCTAFRVIIGKFILKKTIYLRRICESFGILFSSTRMKSILTPPPQAFNTLVVICHYVRLFVLCQAIRGLTLNKVVKARYVSFHWNMINTRKSTCPSLFTYKKIHRFDIFYIKCKCYTLNSIDFGHKQF